MILYIRSLTWINIQFHTSPILFVINFHQMESGSTGNMYYKAEKILDLARGTCYIIPSEPRITLKTTCEPEPPIKVLFSRLSCPLHGRYEFISCQNWLEKLCSIAVRIRQESYIKVIPNLPESFRTAIRWGW